ncbi:MAG: type I-C CRISPR-associated protein Cas8c/Csd1 [Pseudomonadota bacterium]
MLNELVVYADKYLSDSEPGFKIRDVRWSIELDSTGRFLNVLPLGDGKRGADLPRCPDMPGMNAGGKSHFLVETAQTISLLSKPNEDGKKLAGAAVRHRFYVGLLREASAASSRLGLLADVLEDEIRRQDIHTALLSHKVKPTDWLTWRIDGKDPRLEDEVQMWWRKRRRQDEGGPAAKITPRGKPADTGKMVCLITGQATRPLATHPKIAGLSGVGGLAMGDVLVGFDKAAFGSYDLDQSENAAMSEEAAQKYVDALNDLIRNHSRKLANTLVTHWYKTRLPPEDDPLAFLVGMESEETTEAAARSSARRLLESIRKGERSTLGDNHYYALTLSGAAGRVMVRDWMEGQFSELVRHIAAWFDDLEIVARDGQGLARDPKFMAVCGAMVRELKDLSAPTVTALWKAAVQGLPIPQPLLAQALVRFRSDVVDKDQPAFNHARMGLIKAYFVRRKPGGDSTMTASYNPNHAAPAYHCGGLLALLANLQRAALGDVGAGVVQRFYAAASQTPGLVLGRLAANARNHLTKLEPGLAWWYEERIAEVMIRLGDAAPRTLDLEGQGLFALGYYQKLAELRAGNKATSAAFVINEQGAPQ